MIDLKGHKCHQDNLCLLNRNNSIYSVFGNAKGSKTNYRLINESRFLINQYVIDDCVLKLEIENKKCDYLFSIGKEKELVDGYFVEMKGDDIEYACTQLISSIQIIGANFSGKIYARVIQTKNKAPRFHQSKPYLTLKKLLGNKFEYKNMFYEDKV